MSKSVIRQIIDLESKSLEDLRCIYNDIMPKPLKTHVSRDYLRPRIAYRLQELAFGGVNDDVKNKLLTIADDKPHKKKVAPKKLLPGTKICKKWGEITHEVEVLKDGFSYGGQKFKSLSAIAKIITGTKWNGLKFFKIK
jgi:hypothetical protein